MEYCVEIKNITYREIEMTQKDAFFLVILSERVGWEVIRKTVTSLPNVGSII